ncbi:hypothetical protein [Variovorax sp. J22R115]|uniref:hypothetical protein n=1 Tax=Variovorax sp. J22R115 TaxID=3053509 RepID=UPI0025777553|nr:hypothetical protein [Variovorax sp. J22R115]MDM0047798.1 hypothetical protein [Variovorax sp. J22R115]
MRPVLTLPSPPRAIGSLLAAAGLSFAGAAPPLTAEQPKVCDELANVSVEMNRARKQGIPQARVAAAAAAGATGAGTSKAMEEIAQAVYDMRNDNDETVRARVAGECRRTHR